MNIARPAALPSNHAAAAPEQSAANANGAAPNAGTPAFTTELANDPLGIVAGYLPQADQLVMRQAGATVRQVVDATVRCLTLTGAQAGDLLAQPDAFAQLGELRLTDGDDDALAAFAQGVRHGARPPFALVLDREDGVVDIGAAGCRAIALLNLSRIALRGLALPSEAAMALADSRAPVLISLPFVSDDRSDLYRISLIPTLTWLSVGMHPLSAASVEALRSHPVLTTLRAASLSAGALHQLAGSRLQSLSVINEIRGDKAEAFAALASSPSLTSLDIGKVNSVRDMAILARSDTLSTLTLYLGVRGAAGLPALAAMPALAHLSLQGWDERIPVAAGEIAALCAKPLQSLNFRTIQMDAAAFAQVAAARAGSLTWEDGRQVTDAEAAALAANPHLSSLTLGIGMASEAGTMLLARAPNLRRLEIGYSSVAPEVSAQRVEDAWMAAGKARVDLHLDVFDDDEEAVAPLWV